MCVDADSWILICIFSHLQRCGGYIAQCKKRSCMGKKTKGCKWDQSRWYRLCMPERYAAAQPGRTNQIQHHSAARVVSPARKQFTLDSSNRPMTQKCSLSPVFIFFPIAPFIFTAHLRIGLALGSQASQDFIFFKVESEKVPQIKKRYPAELSSSSEVLESEAFPVFCPWG